MKPSRSLNRDEVVLGLTQEDIFLVGVCFAFVSHFVVSGKLSLVPLFLSGLVAVVLSSIRLKNRKGIITDYFKTLKKDQSLRAKRFL